MSVQLAGRAILVVEDEPLIALDIADTIERAGARVIISHRLGDALGVIEAHDWSAAVVDYELPDGDCSSLCEQLTTRGVPFVVHTGHAELPPAFLGGVHLCKPASGDELVETLEQLLSPLARAAPLT
jgi:DNA-binding response OmpR family regulator